MLSNSRCPSLLRRCTVLALAAFGVAATVQLWGLAQTTAEVQAASMQPAWKVQRVKSQPSATQFAAAERMEQPEI